ncbi:MULTISPECIES: hypothetical protein [unclassified Gilliamella]|uniref:hypothetical protein n=1 Tax=unclassified Gilliamella TaxID=2685620 RepID=UPI0013226236|nr:MULTISPECIES: hypothetical protein [unclassified Gilliamella]MWN30838.1 hypothetical protein [Gilliamella sp. Pra-s60]MWP28597.1 hypothetical protein [Gilliamella sp. Pra-s54]
MASGIWHLACQTYALNLIDSHSGQKQAPQLFSSPKSFRVAKSTPSSDIFSAKLSPISKWLSKPPLLFKSPLLSKSALVLASLLLLSYTQSVQALTAQTSRVIEGSAPYLTFDGGRIKAFDIDTLLAIKLPDGRVITRSTNRSTNTNPIRLVNGSTFNDIHMVVPSSQSSISINDLVTQGHWGDDDGDGQGIGGVTATGRIYVSITDKDNHTVSRDDTLSKCNSPYEIRLNNSSGTLTTQYGVPRSSSFSSSGVNYYISTSAGICSVRPSTYTDTTNLPTVWSNGFFVQSTNPSFYGRNFPTTGADGLYFDLNISGINESQLTWSVITTGDITATVSRVNSSTRVTLNGPTADYTKIWSSNPGPIRRPSLPQTFELVGRDGNGNEVKYGFVLKRWFVGRGSYDKPYNDQLAWCRSLGYYLASISDLTNAMCGPYSYFPCVSGINGINGAVPWSNGNYYQRRIGAGLLSEWGRLGSYESAKFMSAINPWHWTSDEFNGAHFYVDSDKGEVRKDYSPRGRDNLAICVAP